MRSRITPRSLTLLSQRSRKATLAASNVSALARSAARRTLWPDRRWRGDLVRGRGPGRIASQSLLPPVPPWRSIAPEGFAAIREYPEFRLCALVLDD